MSFDAHTHLHDKRLDPYRTTVNQLIRQTGLNGLCCCGTSPEDWSSVATLKKQFEVANAPIIIVPAFGVHPWFLDQCKPDWLETLENFLSNNEKAIIGEIGLDGLYGKQSRELQIKFLRAQLELAVKYKRPVSLHGARAMGALINIIDPFIAKLPGFMIHAFSGSQEILKDIVKRNGMVSFAGSVCNPAATRVRLASSIVPIKNLLLETDTPDIFPVEGAVVPGDSKNLNHPGNIKTILKCIAGLRNQNIEELDAITTKNALAFFT